MYCRSQALCRRPILQRPEIGFRPGENAVSRDVPSAGLGGSRHCSRELTKLCRESCDSYIRPMSLMQARLR